MKRVVLNAILIRKALFFTAIALAAAMLVFVAYRYCEDFPVVEQVELRLKDLRFKARGTVKPTDKVAIVAIDAKSVKEIGRWPWSREKTAALIKAISDAGARVTALDIVFSEPQGETPDSILADSILSNGRVICGYFFRDDAAEKDPAIIDQLASSRIKLIRMADGVKEVPVQEFNGVDASLTRFTAVALDQGFFNVIPDSDAINRKAPLLLLYNGDIYPSLSLQALRYYMDEQIIVGVEKFGISEISIGKTILPVSEKGKVSLNFYGPNSTIKTYSAADLINKRLPERSLKDKIVFVGATEKGIADLRPTPLDTQDSYPGVEIHATVAANVLENRLLLRNGWTNSIEIAAIFILPLLLAILQALVSGTAAGLGLFSITTIGYIFLNYFFFARFNQNTSLLYPLVSLSFSYLGVEAYRNLVVERSGRYLKKAFSTYVSSDLVAEIVKNPDRLKLGGEEREITILFSDIRSFTSISEKLSPAELVSMLNKYLSPMTRIVMDEHGTLDKYVGDAIIAIFNAPLDLPDHPAHACRCALKMMERLELLNREFAEQGLPSIDIGIGINTGVAVVGNMGADIRFDYTAIGDNVNLGSRLEGLNKYYGTHILATSATRERAGSGFHFREIDLVRVVGKEQPLRLFELRAEPFQANDEFVSALQKYRSMRFSEAAEAFEKMATEQNDPVSMIYLGRCREYEAVPPNEAWDSVYTALRK